MFLIDRIKGTFMTTSITGHLLIDTIINSIDILPVPTEFNIKKIYMKVYVLLNLLSELRKAVKCEAFRTFYRFPATNLIDLMIQEHEC